jgi:chemotaxis protein histidine kinase CheA
MVDAVTNHRPMTESDLQIIKSADESSARISQDLHDLVMAIRMVEIGETFKLFRRPVRDLARNHKKEIELKFEGEKALVDKALAERLVEPVLHMLRNSADHGLETPIERLHAGKSETGIILLKAIEHEHETEIVVSDDGRGLDEQKIINRAKKQGIIHFGEQPDLLHIVCSSGFSTTEKATDTSGRGVGLDLVNTMVMEFNGTMDLENSPKQGSTFRLHIPKLKAVNIIDALIVRCNDTLYALAIDQVVSLQGLKPDEIQASMDRERFIKYLGTPLALFDLSELLGSGPARQEDPEMVPIVIIEGKKEKIACVVSEFLAPSKLVNVPLAKDMFHRDAVGIAGTCIITGGRVGMTVDVNTTVAKAVGEPIIVDEGHDDAASFGDLAALEPTESTFGISMPSSTTAGHTQEELIAKSKLSAQRDRIAERIEESSQKDLTDTDISDLLTELSRGLMELQDALLSLENDKDPELMKEAFRRLHAAKGNFTMLGTTASANLAHRLETLLDYVRKGQIDMTQELMDVMLDGVSELNQATKMLPQSVPGDNAALLERIEIAMRVLDEEEAITDPDQLLGAPFTPAPALELQLLGALKQGAQAYETFSRFKQGRQAEFLVA